MDKMFITKLEFIFEKVKESGTNSGIEQFIYTVEEVGEIAEVLRCLNGDVRKKNKTKEDLASEIGDTLITLYLITKFEDLDFFYILKNAINKEFDRWKQGKKIIQKGLRPNPLEQSTSELPRKLKHDHFGADFHKRLVKNKNPSGQIICGMPECNEISIGIPIHGWYFCERHVSEQEDPLGQDLRPIIRSAQEANKILRDAGLGGFLSKDKNPSDLNALVKGLGEGFERQHDEIKELKEKQIHWATLENVTVCRLGIEELEEVLQELGKEFINLIDDKIAHGTARLHETSAKDNIEKQLKKLGGEKYGVTLSKEKSRKELRETNSKPPSKFKKEIPQKPITIDERLDYLHQVLSLEIGGRLSQIESGVSILLNRSKSPSEQKLEEAKLESISRHGDIQPDAFDKDIDKWSKEKE